MATLLQIGEQIRQARKALGLSAVKLAAHAGMHRNTLLALETGKGNIELAKLLAICDVLQLTPELVPLQVAQLRRAETVEGAVSQTELVNRLRALMGDDKDAA